MLQSFSLYMSWILFVCSPAGHDGTSELLPLVAFSGNIGAISNLIRVGYDPSDYDNTAIFNVVSGGH
jgi:hypothetical protein